jgi:methionyl-tRNA formyltransferase
LKMAPPPVKERALRLGLEVVQPESVRDKKFVQTLKELNPDLLAVVAFGQILPKEILSIPRMGAVNVHPSKLPHLRGPAPIQWAIIQGLATTAVTTMLMNKRMDAGDILLQELAPIAPHDTAGTLHDKLAVIGGRLLAKTIAQMKAGVLTPTPQDDRKATYVRMIEKKDGHIRWGEPARVICNLVRGLDPWPAAYTTLDGKRLTLFGCLSDEAPTGKEPGQFIGLHDRGLHVAAGEGSVFIREVQFQGRKRMDAASFLNGAKLIPGVVFDSP